MSSLILFGLNPPPALMVPGSGANLKEVIVAALKAEPSLAALLGNRIFPSAIPQEAILPAMAYAVERSEHETDLAGAAGMTWVQIRFEVLSPNMRDCETVKELVRLRFQGLNGYLGPIRIKSVKFERERDFYHSPLPGDDRGTHSKQFDFRFKTPESIPYS